MDVVVREVKVKKQQKAKSSSQQRRRRRPPPPPPPPPLPPPRRPRRPPPRPPPPPRQRQLQSNHQLLLPINSKALLLLLCNGFVQVIRKYLYFSSEQSLLRLSNSFLLPSIHYCRTVSSKQILTRNCSATTCSDDEQHYFEAITFAPAQMLLPIPGNYFLLTIKNTLRNHPPHKKLKCLHNTFFVLQHNVVGCAVNSKF